MSSPVVVVAAVIERDEAFLVTLRPDGTYLGGHWEFPGGKVHPSESHAEALRRELHEELDIIAEVGELVYHVTHAYADQTFELWFYQCSFEGEPKPMMGQGLDWVPRGGLARLKFPEADAALIRLLSARR